MNLSYYFYLLNNFAKKKRKYKIKHLKNQIYDSRLNKYCFDDKYLQKYEHFYKLLPNVEYNYGEKMKLLDNLIIQHQNILKDELEKLKNTDYTNLNGGKLVDGKKNMLDELDIQYNKELNFFLKKSKNSNVQILANKLTLFLKKIDNGDKLLNLNNLDFKKNRMNYLFLLEKFLNKTIDKEPAKDFLEICNERQFLEYIYYLCLLNINDFKFAS